MNQQHHVIGTILAAFTVHGDPKAQPRARAFARNGMVRMYDPGTAESWKGCVALAAMDHVPPAPNSGPLMLTLAFLFKRPKAHYKASGLLKDSAPLWHEKKPDIDNLAKAVMDAATTLGLWHDDKQVATLSTLKRYVVGDERPGCNVTISSLTPQE